jgi:hypothetical protein
VTYEIDHVGSIAFFSSNQQRHAEKFPEKEGGAKKHEYV